MSQLVDWDLAAATAGALGRTGPTVSYTEAAGVVAELRQLTDEAAGHVAGFTGLSGPASPVRVVDRRNGVFGGGGNLEPDPDESLVQEQAVSRRPVDRGH